MNERIKFGSLIFGIILVVGIFHYYALENFLYWKYLWSDLVVHFVSGFWLSLVIYWIYKNWLKKDENLDGINKRVAIYLVLGSLTIGLLWEVFEFYAGIIPYTEWYVNDTISDVLMDVLGAMFGVYLIPKIFNNILEKSEYEI